MANKKLNQLVTKPSIASGDLFPIADATTGQLYKTTISDLGTAIGSGVSSVNGLVGAVVLDTDDIQELASPVNKWFTDLRARAALSAGTGISYSSSTGVIASTITQYTDALARAAVSLTTTGSNGSATYNSTTGVLNVPTYTLSGLGGQPLAGNLTALAGLSYSSLGFIKMTGVGTLALDTNSYYLASNPNSYTANLGTVTSVAALTLGTTGTDLSSSVATGTTTPVITLNVPTASATNRGVLSSADWTTFNGKQAALSGTGFVKISGTTISYDNSTYALDSAVVHNTGAESIAGIKTFTSGNKSDYLWIKEGTGFANPTGYAQLATDITYFHFNNSNNTAYARFLYGSGQRTYTLPSSDGTLALTSNLSSYLPLTGGTLTNAFSNNLNIAQTSGSTTLGHLGQFSDSLYISNNYFYNGNQSYDDTSKANSSIEMGTGFIYLKTGAANTTPGIKLTIAQSGAATFSSSVGIGTSPGFPLDVYTVNGSIANFNSGRTGGGGISMANSGSVRLYLGQANWLGTDGVGTSNNAIALASAQAADILFVTNAANITSGERMRITSGGAVLINKTTQSISNTKFELLQDTNNHASYWSVSSGTGNAIFYQRLDNTANYYSYFTYGTTNVGSISTNGSTTSYNITSDYRLKEDLKPINGLEIVNKINVYDYKWKASVDRMDGVLAHELQEVLPYAVFGEKDGEQMQQVDYSKIVPVMIQAIKDLKAELDTLKNK